MEGKTSLPSTGKKAQRQSGKCLIGAFPENRRNGITGERTTGGKDKKSLSSGFVNQNVNNRFSEREN